MGEGPVRVLLIEDDDDDFFLTKSLFEELPQGAYQLERVAEYSAALHELDNSRHDLYLVDYRLGQYSGLDLLEEANKRGCKAPLIMLTGQREREVDLRAMQAGAVDYLVKDELTATSLERVMRYALQKKRHEETIRRVNQELERRVHERTAELEQANAHLQNEIAERKRAEEALRQADRRKDEFLATLAHELRNPLTPLVTSIELIRRARGVASEKQLDIMSRQTRQLSRLVEDLLDVSRVNRGRIELRRHRLKLRDVITDALEASRPFLDSRRHRVEVKFCKEDINLHADNVRLAQVFANILHNAGKYTDPGGTIRIATDVEAGEAFVRVTDNGLGIDPSMIESVFDLFTQAPMSLERAQGGLGIGLTLVRALVELHGGRVQASSEGLGRGSTITVRLPISARTESEARPETPAPAEAPADRPMRVLVVDDNEDAANSMADMLRLMGHHAEVAFSGLKAMHMAEDVEPDLVLLDIGLPEVDGYEVARRVRLSNRRTVRLVAVTGYGSESDKRRSREAGFDEHVVKPVMPETLYAIIERARAPC